MDTNFFFFRGDGIESVAMHYHDSARWFRIVLLFNINLYIYK